MPRNFSPIVMALLVSACFRNTAPNGLDPVHQHAVQYRAATQDAAPTEAAGVVVHDSLKDLPEGIFSDNDGRELRVVPGYPNEEHPHVLLGRISLKEQFETAGWNFEELKASSKNDRLKEQRAALLAAEAARHGANALYPVGYGSLDFKGRIADRTLDYMAVRLSPDPIRYPGVAKLLESLDLTRDGYHETKRFTAKLEDLRTRAPESISLERGHCYMLAIAFHPEPIERPRDKVNSINFITRVPKPEVFPGIPVIVATGGTFQDRLGPNKSDGASWHVLDGVWSRAGAGPLACPVYRTQSAALSFTTFTGLALPSPPPLEAGKGTADLVLYDRKLPAKEFTSKACGRCNQLAEQCYRRLPKACSELAQCQQTTGMEAGACPEDFR